MELIQSVEGLKKQNQDFHEEEKILSQDSGASSWLKVSICQPGLQISD